MNKNLTIQIIIQNNESSIEECLTSLSGLKAHIILADIGSTDKTLEICKKLGHNPNSYAFADDYSKLRNKLIQPGWNLMLEPWEVLIHGADVFEAITDVPFAYRVGIMQNDAINRAVRLWHTDLKIKFTNPVFEILDTPAEHADIYFKSLPHVFDAEPILEKWRYKEPLSTQIQYYSACCYLQKKQWTKFLDTATEYLFHEKKNQMSLIMTHYYCAMVQSYILKNHKKAAAYLVPCLAEKPLMAEFWCLLGDIYLENKSYLKAAEFYENGILLGKHRTNDAWPLEISKYNTYPEKMRTACLKIEENSKALKGLRLN